MLLPDIKDVEDLEEEVIVEEEPQEEEEDDRKCAHIVEGQGTLLMFAIGNTVFLHTINKEM